MKYLRLDIKQTISNRSLNLCVGFPYFRPWQGELNIMYVINCLFNSHIKLNDLIKDL